MFVYLLLVSQIWLTSSANTNLWAFIDFPYLLTIDETFPNLSPTLDVLQSRDETRGKNETVNLPRTDPLNDRLALTYLIAGLP